MRSLLLSILLLVLDSSAFPQGSSINAKSPNSLNDKWDLNKYVWSQTHLTQKGGKPALDYDALDNWEQLDNVRLSISPDGKYFAYGTFKGTTLLIPNYGLDHALIIQSTDNGWKKSFPVESVGFFAGDSKQYIFQQKDNLVFVKTNTDGVQYVHSVLSYKVSSANNTEWIAYQLKGSDSTVVLKNLIEDKERTIDNVLSYSFSKSGKWLACQLKQQRVLIHNLETGTAKLYDNVDSYLFDGNGTSLMLKFRINNGQKTSSLQYVNLQSEESRTIWSSQKNKSIDAYQFDKSGKQAVFIVSETSAKDGDKSIWYYKDGMEKAIEKVNNQTSGIKQPLYIQGFASFTDNGDYIQFALQAPKEEVVASPDAVKVDVWNYKDAILQSTQMNKKKLTTFQTVLNIESGKLIQLEDKEKKLRQLHGDFAVVTIRWHDQSDRFWEEGYGKDSIWLVSLKDGSRRLLPVYNAEMVWFSPFGNYLVYYDVQHGCHYYSYDLNTGKGLKISAGIPNGKLGFEEFEVISSKPSVGVGIAGWVIDDTAILVYDNYDIWQLSLTAKKTPINITNGYGSKNNTQFSLLEKGRYTSSYLIQNRKDTLLLLAFNRTNKYSGYYSKVLGVPGNPELLFKGPFFFQVMGYEMAFSNGMYPARAAKSATWIVQRQTSTEAPNYFLTNDFKAFKQLTNLQPQKSYNWLTAELHSFKRLDGTTGQGILYKPENFNSKKKYPLIIAIYGPQTSQLHQFPTPEYITDASIFRDVPWMVSHEYLVFLPDNLFTKRGWGPSTVSTAVGAANYLSKLPFVDSTKLGACGHSNGGRFGYYLFTHSSCFAAMSVGSGTTDIISNGLSLYADDPLLGASRLEWAESIAYGGPLGNLWTNKPRWIDHASVLHADKVKSPLLMFQCKRDAAYFQGVEMFISLRRLCKPAWLLQYDNGGHELNYDSLYRQDMKDYTIRYTQFYDHFLKGAPAPRWMTEGVPYAIKGMESRLELNPSRSCNKTCKVCKTSNR